MFGAHIFRETLVDDIRAIWPARTAAYISPVIARMIEHMQLRQDLFLIVLRADMLIAQQLLENSLRQLACQRIRLRSAQALGGYSIQRDLL